MSSNTVVALNNEPPRDLTSARDSSDVSMRTASTLANTAQKRAHMTLHMGKHPPARSTDPEQNHDEASPDTSSHDSAVDIDTGEVTAPNHAAPIIPATQESVVVSSVLYNLDLDNDPLMYSGVAAQGNGQANLTSTKISTHPSLSCPASDKASVFKLAPPKPKKIVHNPIFKPDFEAQKKKIRFVNKKEYEAKLAKYSADKEKDLMSDLFGDDVPLPTEEVKPVPKPTAGDKKVVSTATTGEVTTGRAASANVDAQDKQPVPAPGVSSRATKPKRVATEKCDATITKKKAVAHEKITVAVSDDNDIASNPRNSKLKTVQKSSQDKAVPTKKPASSITAKKAAASKKITIELSDTDDSEDELSKETKVIRTRKPTKDKAMSKTTKAVDEKPLHEPEKPSTKRKQPASTKSLPSKATESNPKSVQAPTDPMLHTQDNKRQCQTPSEDNTTQEHAAPKRKQPSPRTATAPSSQKGVAIPKRALNLREKEALSKRKRTSSDSWDEEDSPPAAKKPTTDHDTASSSSPSFSPGGKRKRLSTDSEDTLDGLPAAKKHDSADVKSTTSLGEASLSPSLLPGGKRTRSPHKAKEDNEPAAKKQDTSSPPHAHYSGGASKPTKRRSRAAPLPSPKTPTALLGKRTRTAMNDDNEEDTLRTAKKATRTVLRDGAKCKRSAIGDENEDVVPKKAVAES